MNANFRIGGNFMVFLQAPGTAQHDVDISAYPPSIPGEVSASGHDTQHPSMAQIPVDLSQVIIPQAMAQQYIVSHQVTSGETDE